MSFVVDLIAMILGMPRALFPQMAHESFGGPVEGGTTMALLAAAIAVGAVAGGVFSGWLPRIQRQGLAVVVAIVVWGVAMIGFGVAGGSGARPCRGRCCGLRWCSWLLAARPTWCRAAFRNTILQQAASDDVRGRLQGVFTVVVAGGPAAGRRGARRGRGRRRHHGRRGGRWRARRGRRGDRGARCARVRALPGEPNGRRKSATTRPTKSDGWQFSQSLHSFRGVSILCVPDVRGDAGPRSAGT